MARRQQVSAQKLRGGLVRAEPEPGCQEKPGLAASESRPSPEPQEDVEQPPPRETGEVLELQAPTQARCQGRLSARGCVPRVHQDRLASGLLLVRRADSPWPMENLDGHRVECTAEELQQPRLFQRKLLLPLMKMVVLPKDEGTWAAIVTRSLQTAQKIEVPPEATQKGALLNYFEQWSCQSRAYATELGEIVTGRPFTDHDGNRICFRLQDFMEYLTRVKFQISQKEVVKVLRDHGAVDRRADVEVYGETKQIRLWQMPGDHFQLRKPQKTLAEDKPTF